jgi:hypothetical protein
MIRQPAVWKSCARTWPLCTRGLMRLGLPAGELIRFT